MEEAITCQEIESERLANHRKRVFHCSSGEQERGGGDASFAKRARILHWAKEKRRRRLWMHGENNKRQGSHWL